MEALLKNSHSKNKIKSSTQQKQRNSKDKKSSEILVKKTYGSKNRLSRFVSSSIMSESPDAFNKVLNWQQNSSFKTSNNTIENELNEQRHSTTSLVKDDGHVLSDESENSSQNNSVTGFSFSHQNLQQEKEKEGYHPNFKNNVIKSRLKPRSINFNTNKRKSREIVLPEVYEEDFLLPPQELMGNNESKNSAKEQSSEVKNSEFSTISDATIMLTNNKIQKLEERNIEASFENQHKSMFTESKKIKCGEVSRKCIKSSVGKENKKTANGKGKIHGSKKKHIETRPVYPALSCLCTLQSLFNRGNANHNEKKATEANADSQELV